MNSYFNMKRFANYLVYDFKNLRNRYFWMMALAVIIPLAFYILYTLCCYISFLNFYAPDEYERATPAIIEAVVFAVTLPLMCYGSLTEKRQGSNWLMVPASAFEKFTSMMIVLCTATFVSMSSYVLMDTIICMLDSRCGEPLYKELPDMICSVGEVYLHVILNILIYLLGALTFRKAKVVCTFITQIVSFVLMISFALAVNYYFIYEANILERMIWMTILMVSLGTAVFLRIKNLKH